MPGSLDEVVETLAHHFEQGAVWPKAAEYCLRAADKAKQRYTYSTALEFAQQGGRDRRARSGARGRPPAGARAAGRPAQPDRRARDRQPELRRRARARSTATSRASASRANATAPGIAVRDGARIAYYLHGAGDETLLFVNPVVYGLEVFQPIVERLCQEFRIVTIDPRGTGSSDPLQRPYGLTPARARRARGDRAGRSRRRDRRRHLARQQSPGPARPRAPETWCAGWS